MPRYSTIPFDRPLLDPDEIEESDPSRGDSVLQSRIKLGTAWVGATLAGVLALAYSAISEFHQAYTMLGLLAVLVAYTGYGFSLKKKNTAQFADSLYYMGFLWALFALGATFVFWPAPKLTTDAILASFGYALAATFGGMLLRMVVVQFQDTRPDQIVYAQEAIDRRVATLVEQINEATTDIASFRERAVSELGGTFHDLVRSLTNVREMIAEQQLAMAKTMSADFESSLKDMLGRFAQIHIPQEMLTTEVTKLVGALGKRGEEFNNSAQKLNASLLQAAEMVAVFGESLCGSEGAKQVETAVGELSRRIKERTDQFADMTAALEKSRTELGSQLSSLQSLRSAVSMVSSQLSAFETELRELSSASMSTDVRNGLMSMQQAIHSSLEASQAIESTMRDVLFFMRGRMTEEHSSGRN